jgi:hypothetical protein
VTTRITTMFCAFRLHEMCKDYPPSMRGWCECMCHEDQAILAEIELL